MSPLPQPTDPLTYGNALDLLTPIYFVLSVAITVAIFYAVYSIIIKPWLRNR